MQSDKGRRIAEAAANFGPFLKRYWAVSGAGGAFALYGVFGDVKGMMQDISQNLDRLYHAPDTAGVRWIFIGIGLALLFWGAWRAGFGNEKLRKQLSGAIKDFDQLPMLVATYQVQRAEEGRQKAIAEAAYGGVENYRETLHRLSRGEEVYHRAQHRYELNEMCRKTHDAITELRTLADNLPDWNFVARDPVPVFQSVPGMADMHFVPAENQLFLEEHYANAQALTAGLANIRENTLVPRWQQLRYTAERLEQEASKYAERP